MEGVGRGVEDSSLRFSSVHIYHGYSHLVIRPSLEHKIHKNVHAERRNDSQNVNESFGEKKEP